MGSSCLLCWVAQSFASGAACSVASPSCGSQKPELACMLSSLPSKPSHFCPISPPGDAHRTGALIREEGRRADRSRGRTETSSLGSPAGHSRLPAAGRRTHPSPSLAVTAAPGAAGCGLPGPEPHLPRRLPGVHLLLPAGPLGADQAARLLLRHLDGGDGRARLLVSVLCAAGASRGRPGAGSHLLGPELSVSCPWLALGLDTLSCALNTPQILISGVAKFF